ncbi:MAG: DEAD/DEAH box helicase [Kiritimatiellae bacterium]|nr:DEAD/DEAH box helicase [Kiritimatiellia bacterium]
MSGTNESLELSVTPQGFVTALPYAGGERWAAGAAARFAEHEAAGLTALAAASLPHGAHGSVLFWRDVAAGFVRTLCHLPENTPLGPDTIEMPAAARLAEWVLNAPPMQGAEYLAPDTLAAVWRRLADWTAAQAASCGGLGAFLETYAPHWSRVGRVTLHLAEHKGDADYPFAFMATYAAGLSRGGRISRLPLGQALREYAGARRKPELLKLLSPLHAAAQRSTLIAELVETGDVFHPLVWTPAEAYAFLKEIPLYEACGLLAQLPNWWRKRARPRVAVTLDSSKENAALGTDALLDFQVGLALGDQQLSAEETRALLAGTEGLVLLRGEWVEADAAKLREALDHWKRVEQEAAAGGLSFIEGMRLLAGASADLKDDGAGEAHADWSSVAAGARLREALAGLRTPSGLLGVPPAGFQGTLRHYQLDGLNWLWFCAQLGLGACLADDMGLGKTIQVLAALLRRKEQTARKGHAMPSLLVVPASLIGNWKAEAARFAPRLALFIAHPSETPADTLAECGLRPKEHLRGTDLVVTTYGMVSRLNWLAAFTWHWVILDEAQAIKNPGTSQTRAVKKLRGAARMALTGTPVENRLGDLWSIFDFLNPGLLGSAQRFKAFAKTIENREHARYAPLRNLVAPYILRRLKTDPAIVPDLPDKTEMQVFCGLSKRQAVLYQQNVTALSEALQRTDGDRIRRRGLVLAHLMRFKQICNHPSQLTGDAVYEPAASAKFERLGALCGEIASRGEKALVFTQFREITEPLAEFLATVFGRGGLVLHGGTAVKQRKRLVADFQRADGPPFFVLSIKAGGTGLNLTAASHVIHVDRWWNPAVENQATDRVFRIGQHRNVLVHKFVTRGTVEEKIDALIREKQDMADALLEGGAETALTEMSDEQLVNLVSLDIERAGD